jgi:hypothetical protein
MDVSRSEELSETSIEKKIEIDFSICKMHIFSYKYLDVTDWAEPRILIDNCSYFSSEQIPDLIEALTYAKKAAEEMEEENKG